MEELTGRTSDFTSNLSKDHVVVEPPSWRSQEERLRPGWSSCQAGTQKTEGSVALPSGDDPRTEQQAPTLQPSNKERALTQEPPLSKRKVFRPRCTVFALAWLAAPVLFLGCSFSRARSWHVPVYFLFLLLFLSIGRGRQVPAPGGRDVGSNARAPTQEPVLGTDPRTRS